MTTVDEYIAGQPAAARGILEAVRGAIRRAAPGAEESISYGIPTYKLGGARLIYFAAWKKHFSLYPIGEREVAAFPELAALKIEKSTVRFPWSGGARVELIERVTRFRAETGV